MSLDTIIIEEMKLAMKSGEKLRLDTLRSIRAGILEFKTSGIGREMNEDDELKLLKSNAKKRKDAIEMYEKAGRTELMDKEKEELAIIESFLPVQLSQEDVRSLIIKIKEESGANDSKDMGKLMGAAMKELKGKADGAMVQSIVRELLGNG